MKKKIKNLKELQEFVRRFSEPLQPGDAVGLVGELGTGKTTFVQMLAKALGVRGRVNSPTFLVMRIYYTRSQKSEVRSQKSPTSNFQLPTSHLVHIDAYRLKSARELEAIGADEYIGAPDAITVVEWADRVRSVLPKHTKWIYLEHGKKPEERIIKF